MPYQVILIESDQVLLNNMIATIKKSSEFELAATFKTANAALGQSSILCYVQLCKLIYATGQILQIDVVPHIERRQLICIAGQPY